MGIWNFFGSFFAKKEDTYSLLQPFRYAALAALHRASLQNGGGIIQQQRQQQTKHHVNDTVLLEQYRGQRDRHADYGD